MNTLLEGLRSILGVANFYPNGVLDYGVMTEYILGGVILTVVVYSVFRIIGKVIG